MEGVKGTTMLIVCAVIGLFSALATRDVFLGVGYNVHTLYCMGDVEIY